MKVYVTGASGFIGRRVVARLLEQGHSVVAFTRDPSKLPADPRVEIRQVDLLKLEQILPAIKDCEAGIHAAGLGPSHSEAAMQAINVQGTRNLVATCRQARVPRVIVLSSAAVLEAGDTPYRRCKIGQEAAVRSYAPAFTLLRPTAVIGPAGDSDDLRRLADKLKAGGTFWIPGGGTIKVQPVDVDDVAAAAVAALERPETVGKSYVIAGPEPGIAYRDFLDQARKTLGAKGSCAGMPLFPMRIASVFAGLVGLAGPIKAQLKYYSTDHVYPLAETRSALGFEPRGYDALIARAFGTGA